MSQCAPPPPEKEEVPPVEELCKPKPKCPPKETTEGAPQAEPEEPELDPCNDPDFAGGDLQEKYRALCRRTKECKSFYKKLTECNDRVNSRTKTEEKCMEEVIDYVHCVDHCAAKRFFKLLK